MAPEQEPEDLDRQQLDELLAELHYWLDTGSRVGGGIATDEWVQQSLRQFLHEFDQMRDMVDIVNTVSRDTQRELDRAREVEPPARALLALLKHGRTTKVQRAAMDDLTESLDGLKRRTDRPKRG